MLSYSTACTDTKAIAQHVHAIKVYTFPKIHTQRHVCSGDWALIIAPLRINFSIKSECIDTNDYFEDCATLLTGTNISHVIHTEILVLNYFG